MAADAPQLRASERTLRFKVEGMDCSACASKIEAAVRRLPGVNEIAVSVSNGTATVVPGRPLAPDDVIRQIIALGYNATLLAAEKGGTGNSSSIKQPDSADLHLDIALAESGKPWWQSPRGILTISCGAALVLAFLIGKLVPTVERWAFIAALAVGLVPIARRAIAAARHGTPFSIEMLMTIAAVGAVIIGATEEAATVVFLFLVGELLEGVAAGRARRSIQELTNLIPKTALLEQGEGRVQEVSADTLEVGSIVVVRPGDRIPADGIIQSGESSLDEAPVTGESAPKRKVVNDAVFAGTINGEGVLRIQVTAAASDNTVARVVKLVEEAQESKAPTERFIDRFSRYYTPAVLALGAAVATVPPVAFGQPWHEWIYKGLAILLIGCPCALVISTPAAIAAGLSAGARRGLLLKGGAVLETLGKIGHVAFDKTGTLTEGRPKVTDVIGYGGSEAEVLTLAAALEAGSNHPLAKAILEKAGTDGTSRLSAKDTSAVAGKGVIGTVDGKSIFLGSPPAAKERAVLTPEQQSSIEALNSDGKTVSVLISDGAVSGLIAMRDEPRADAKSGVAALKAAGIGATMVTGDNARTAYAVASGLGLTSRAELMPEDKQVIVRELQRGGQRVAKVGDGINDAPALAAADVGIAMGGGTDVALETADAAILHGRVMDVWHMVRLSRGVMANIYQNIAIALGLKAVFLVTTLVGITGLWPAILADTGATVLVTANALRLLTYFRND